MAWGISPPRQAVATIKPSLNWVRVALSMQAREKMPRPRMPRRWLMLVSFTRLR